MALEPRPQSPGGWREGYSPRSLHGFRDMLWRMEKVGEEQEKQRKEEERGEKECEEMEESENRRQETSKERSQDKKADGKGTSEGSPKRGRRGRRDRGPAFEGLPVFSACHDPGGMWLSKVRFLLGTEKGECQKVEKGDQRGG
ncbi:hypothetical protein NDU88_004286 [Pleurodeles waltl]|uniref:Uncharacterized protein n=1 Tax=Pleurodeles waltl TaxID=8319 RepID=A0AAV7LKY2_PLEWA|nr:hypothetical protein NDU88_004286 [Pleurodeles waltl]